MATNKAIKATVKPAGWGIRIRSFFQGVWAELKKVHWPARGELVIYVEVVIISVAAVMGLIWVLDSVFSFLLKLIVS